MSDYDESATAQHAAEDAARAAGGEYRPRHNGWSNRETWNTNLWIDNEEGSYEAAREIVRDAMAADPFTAFTAFTGHRPSGETPESTRSAQLHRAASALREWWDELAGPDDPGTPLSDAWTYALAWVNWAEIAEGLAEE